MMRDGDFGAIPVGANDHLKGMVTDRDIVVGAIARARDAGAGEALSKVSESAHRERTH